jgi:hypothetical protein
MSLLSFNINNSVWVKLTELGRSVYLADAHAWREALPEIARKNLTPVQLPVDEEGYSRFSGWEFMRVFGPYMYLGAPGVFDMNIRINSDNIHPIERNI